MIRKMFYLVAVVAMVTLFSFAAQAQDAQIQRKSEAYCRAATEIKIHRAERISPLNANSGVEVNWEIVRKSPACPIKQLHVLVVLQTVKTRHAEASTQTFSKVLSPGLRHVQFIIPAHKVVIFTASDARLKITPTITPMF